MNKTLLLLLFCTLSFTTSAEWIEQRGGAEFHSASIQSDAHTELVARLGSGVYGEPSISFSAKENSEFYKRFCAKKTDNEQVDVAGTINFQPISFYVVCLTGGYGLSFGAAGQDQTNILKAFKESSGNVTLLIGDVSAKYSVLGFDQAYTQLSTILRNKSKEWLSKILSQSIWTKDGSMLGFNIYGSTPPDLPSAELYLNREGAVQIAFKFAWMTGGIVSVKYCNHNNPRKGSFLMPSFEVNGIKVKMLGMCHKFSDVDMSYMMLYPETDKGNKYIINEFEDKAYVKIDQAYYSAKGFNKVLSALKNTIDGI